MKDPYVEIPELTDAQLVVLARESDQAAFGELIRRYRQKCVNLANFFLRDEGDAEDQVQIALLKAYEHLDQYHGDAEFSTWLARIVANQCLMLMRVRRRARFLYLDDVPFQPKALLAARPDPESELVLKQLIQVLRREVGLMPQILRNVMLLRDVRGLPTTDVATQLGISVACAKSRLVRARSELRSRMVKHYQKIAYSSRSVVPLYNVNGRPAVRAA